MRLRRRVSHQRAENSTSNFASLEPVSNHPSSLCWFWEEFPLSKSNEAVQQSSAREAEEDFSLLWRLRFELFEEICRIYNRIERLKFLENFPIWAPERRSDLVIAFFENTSIKSRTFERWLPRKSADRSALGSGLPRNPSSFQPIHVETSSNALINHVINCPRFRRPSSFAIDFVIINECLDSLESTSRLPHA